MRSRPIGQRIEVRVTSHWIPEQSASHIELLESSDQSQGRAQFDAILVPTNRPVEFLSACISLAQQTAIPLIVVCSKRVKKRQVIEVAERENVEVFAVDLPEYPANPLVGTSFGTSTDEDLLAASSGKTRDLSTKRNLGLVIAKMLGWRRLMFLDDDIYGISKEDVEALAAALNNHNVSVAHPRVLSGQLCGLPCFPARRGRAGHVRQRGRNGSPLRLG